MSSAVDSRTYSVDIAAYREAFRQAGQSIGLREKVTSDVFLKMGEGFSLLSFGWPATNTATLRTGGPRTVVG